MKKLWLILAVFAILARPASSDWTPPGAPEFVFARLEVSNRVSWQYWPDYFPDNPPWHHDYPLSDEFIIGLLHELTNITVAPTSYKIVRLDSPDVFKYPFVYLSEPGFLVLTDAEIKNLGEYIRRGGFIMCDDFRTGEYLGGPEELEVLRHYLKLAVPERELVRLNINHPIFHSFYDIDTLNMDPPYGMDINPLTGRRAFPDFIPQFWGMSDEHGRLQVIANYNNDIGDFWKYLDRGEAPLHESARAIRLGINYIVYAMSH